MSGPRPLLSFQDLESVFLVSISFVPHSGRPGAKKWKAIIMARMDEDGVLGDKHRTLELPKLFLSFSTLWLGGRMNPDVRGALRMSTHLEVPYLSRAICAAILMPLLQYSVGGLGHENPSPTSCI